MLHILNSLMHLNSWFYFLILTDELLAIAAGNYWFEKREKNKSSE